MPDFTVIEGGGGGDGGSDRYAAQRARDAFERLAIELLRALARGDDWGCRVSDALVRFCDRFREIEQPLPLIVHEAVEALHNNALGHDPFDDRVDSQHRAILAAALKAAAESMASDPAAKGRRFSEMQQFIDQHLVDAERSSRENGWSFTQDMMMRRLGPWPPMKPRTAKAARAKKPPRR